MSLYFGLEKSLLLNKFKMILWSFWKDLNLNDKITMPWKRKQKCMCTSLRTYCTDKTFPGNPQAFKAPFKNITNMIFKQYWNWLQTLEQSCFYQIPMDLYVFLCILCLYCELKKMCMFSQRKLEENLKAQMHINAFRVNW